MTYANGIGGRVCDGASGPGSNPSGDDFWTFAAVEERLVEAMRLWRRSPGGGKWPFAADAPWHLMTRRTRVAIGVDAGIKGMDMTRLMQAEDDDETRRREGRDASGPLTRADVARRDEASEWLGWLASDARKVVIGVIVQLASGRRENVDWKRVKDFVGAEIGNKGVYRRYTRAIASIAAQLNRSDA